MQESSQFEGQGGASGRSGLNLSLNFPSGRELVVVVRKIASRARFFVVVVVDFGILFAMLGFDVRIGLARNCGLKRNTIKFVIFLFL